MYFTRCLSCKISLWREQPFRLQDRVCVPCMMRFKDKIRTQEQGREERTPLRSVGRTGVINRESA
jgi:hypothetical protein